MEIGAANGASRACRGAGQATTGSGAWPQEEAGLDVPYFLDEFQRKALTAKGPTGAKKIRNSRIYLRYLA